MADSKTRVWQSKVLALRECDAEVDRLISEGDMLALEGDSIGASAKWVQALDMLRVAARVLGMGCAGSADGRWDVTRALLATEVGYGVNEVSVAIWGLHKKGVRGALALWVKVNDAATGLPPNDDSKSGCQLVFDLVED